MSQGEYGIPEIISFNGNCVLGANVNFTLFTIPAGLLDKLSDAAKRQMGKEIQEIIDKYEAIENGWEATKDEPVEEEVDICPDCGESQHFGPC